MSWLKVDDRAADDPEVEGAGEAALGALIILGAWSARHLTDGRVPIGKARKLVSAPALNAALKAGWLTKADDTLVIATDLVHVRSAEEVRTERAASSARQAALRMKRARERLEAAAAAVEHEAGHAASHAGSNGVTSAVTSGAGHAVTPPVSHVVSHAPPTRPDPTRPVVNEEERESPRVRPGARLAALWEEHVGIPCGAYMDQWDDAARYIAAEAGRRSVTPRDLAIALFDAFPAVVERMKREGAPAATRSFAIFARNYLLVFDHADGNQPEVSKPNGNGAKKGDVKRGMAPVFESPEAKAARQRLPAQATAPAPPPLDGDEVIHV